MTTLNRHEIDFITDAFRQGKDRIIELGQQVRDIHAKYMDAVEENDDLKAKMKVLQSKADMAEYNFNSLKRIRDLHTEGLERRNEELYYQLKHLQRDYNDLKFRMEGLEK